MKTFDYTDEHGKLIYQIVREDFEGGGKNFKQRHPDGNGGWFWNIDHVTPVPYRLPDVIRIVRQGGLVLLVEGEKCADALNAAVATANLCAVATCNNGGAGKWGSAQSKWLANARVCVLPDNDVQGFNASRLASMNKKSADFNPGMAHAQIASRSLRAVGVGSLRLVTLPDLPEKGDVADWLAAGHNVAELRALYHAAPEYTPPAAAVVIAPAAKPAQVPVTSDDRPRLRAWANAALDNIVSELAGLSDGRYHAMKAAANRLGTIADHGLLTESECLNALRWAMDSNGYSHKKGKGERGAEREAQFYFRSGLGHPCALPSARELPALEKGVPDDFVAYIPDDTRPMWDKGVPVAVRGLMNLYQTTGPLLELLFEAKARKLLCDDQCITIDCLTFLSKTLKRGLTEKVIRTMVKAACESSGVDFLRKSLHIYTDHREEQEQSPVQELVQSTSTESSTAHGHVQASTAHANPCGCDQGRSPETYALYPIEHILSHLARYLNAPLIKAAFPDSAHLIAPVRAEFLAAIGNADLTADLEARYGDLIAAQDGFGVAMQGVDQEHQRLLYRLKNPQMAPLPDGVPYKNVAAYKVVCARAFVVSRHGRVQIGRKLLCAFIGCKDAALKSILDRAGVLMDKFKYGVRLVASMTELTGIQARYDKTWQGFPKLVEVEGQRLSLRAKSGKEAAQGAFSACIPVKVLYHQANLYIVKRLTRMGQRLLKLLLALLAVKYDVPDEEKVQLPLLPEPVVEVKAVEKAKPEIKPVVVTKPVKPLWEESWIKKLAYEEAPTAGKGFDPVTGEVVRPETVQQAVQALLFDTKPKIIPKEEPELTNLLTPRQRLLADPRRLALIRDQRRAGQDLKAHKALFTGVEADVKELWALPDADLDVIVLVAEADEELGIYGEDWDLGQVTGVFYDLAAR